MATTAQLVGIAAENRALHYLQDQGLTLCTRNYRSPMGEVDLIMREGATLVFVEVRYRSHPSYGSGSESITLKKRQRILKTALYYLKHRRIFQKMAIRFDVISIDALQRIDWIADAFGAEDG